MKYTIEAYADCGMCHGSGEVVDWVPYWGATVPMYTGCEACVERAFDEGILPEEADDIEIVPSR